MKIEPVEGLAIKEVVGMVASILHFVAKVADTQKVTSKAANIHQVTAVAFEYQGLVIAKESVDINLQVVTVEVVDINHQAVADLRIALD